MNATQPQRLPYLESILNGYILEYHRHVQKPGSYNKSGQYFMSHQGPGTNNFNTYVHHALRFNHLKNPKFEGGRLIVFYNYSGQMTPDLVNYIEKRFTEEFQLDLVITTYFEFSSSTTSPVIKVSSGFFSETLTESHNKQAPRSNSNTRHSLTYKRDNDSDDDTDDTDDDDSDDDEISVGEQHYFTENGDEIWKMRRRKKTTKKPRGKGAKTLIWNVVLLCFFLYVMWVLFFGIKIEIDEEIDENLTHLFHV